MKSFFADVAIMLIHHFIPILCMLTLAVVAFVAPTLARIVIDLRESGDYHDAYERALAHVNIKRPFPGIGDRNPFSYAVVESNYRPPSPQTAQFPSPFEMVAAHLNRIPAATPCLPTNNNYVVPAAVPIFFFFTPVADPQPAEQPPTTPGLRIVDLPEVAEPSPVAMFLRLHDAHAFQEAPQGALGLIGMRQAEAIEPVSNVLFSDSEALINKLFS